MTKISIIDSPCFLFDRRQKTWYIVVETGIDEDTSPSVPAQRGPFTGCKGGCQALRRLPLPSRAPRQGAPGPPVTEATSGSALRCKQGGTVEYFVSHP